MQKFEDAQEELVRSRSEIRDLQNQIVEAEAETHVLSLEDQIFLNNFVSDLIPFKYKNASYQKMRKLIYDNISNGELPDITLNMMLTNHLVGQDLNLTRKGYRMLKDTMNVVFPS